MSPDRKEKKQDALVYHVTPEITEHLEIFGKAQTGDFEPLARYIEGGGALTPELREFLAAHLRGELRFKRGTRRTITEMKEGQRLLHRRSVIQREKSVSKEVATFILSEETGINPDTIRTQLKKAETEAYPNETVIGPQYRKDPPRRR